MRRRAFLALPAALLAAPLAKAREHATMRRIGFLFPNPRAKPEHRARDPGRLRLQALGSVEGENAVFEVASADGREERLAALAAELVEKKVEVIWAAGPEAAVAAARATKTIPIVFYGVGYPIEQGLVDSLARPGRNVTGLASLSEADWSKRLELLREIAPGRVRLAWIAVETVLVSVSGDRIRATRWGSIEAAAASFGFELRRYAVSKREDFDGVFTALPAAEPQALYCDFTALTFRERQRIADFANHNRLPSAFGAAPFVEAGGLLSYGANRMGMILDSFNHVDRILRGARPEELPVELPSRFELVINLGTAKALGLTVPQSILLRADRVIE